MKFSTRTSKMLLDGAIPGLTTLIGLSLYSLPTIIVEIRRTEHGGGTIVFDNIGDPRPSAGNVLFPM
jgi:hypothetical protein